MSPPSSVTRSRIPSRPKEADPAIRSSVIPFPLSSTANRMDSPPFSTRTTTRVASACRATLVSASWTMRNRASSVSRGSRASAAWAMRVVIFMRVRSLNSAA